MCYRNHLVRRRGSAHGTSGRCPFHITKFSPGRSCWARESYSCPEYLMELATLLIPGFKPQDEVTERSLVMGEDIIPLKPLTDQRLHRPLTITEFVKAFTIYKKVMCEVYPERHDELDSYLHEIVDMATRYPGLIFYEYHRQFSVRAASRLERGVKVNWAVRDTKLFCSLFSAHKANACSVCGNVAHPTDFCPLISKRPATRPSGAPARANAPGGSHDQGGRPQASSLSSGIWNL